MKGRFAPEALPDALAKFPKDAWPYGKVVAVQEVGIRSGNDDRLIGDNLTKVLKVLKERGMKVERWPSS
jgi:hypothetical protein